MFSRWLSETSRTISGQSDAAYKLFLKRTTYPSCSEELVAEEQPRTIYFLSNSNISQGLAYTQFVAQKTLPLSVVSLPPIPFFWYWSQLCFVTSFSCNILHLQWFSPVKKLGQYFLICFPLSTSNALQTVAMSQENSKLFSIFTPSNFLEAVASDNRKRFADLTTAFMCISS